jgi:hypothetical protein
LYIGAAVRSRAAAARISAVQVEPCPASGSGTNQIQTPEQQAKHLINARVTRNSKAIHGDIVFHLTLTDLILCRMKSGMKTHSKQTMVRWQESVVIARALCAQATR